MSTITEMMWNDILSGIGNVEPWPKEGVGMVDILIVAAGFEDRARAILDPSYWPNPKSLMTVIYPTNYKDNEMALSSMRERARDCLVTEVIYKRGNFRQSLRRHLCSKVPSTHIVVDISGMSSYVIFSVMGSIWEFCRNASVTIF